MQSRWSVDQYHFSFLFSIIFLLSSNDAILLVLFRFFIYIECFGDKLPLELFLSSLHSILLQDLKYVSN